MCGRDKEADEEMTPLAWSVRRAFELLVGLQQARDEAGIEDRSNMDCVTYDELRLARTAVWCVAGLLVADPVCEEAVHAALRHPEHAL